jgi:hypothetical protein
MRIRTRVVATSVVLAAAVPVTPGLSAERAFINVGTKHPKYKPSAFPGGSGVACGVFNAKRVHWTRWTSREAIGTGTVVYNTGDGGCAAGNMAEKRARFRAFRPRRGCQIYAGGRFLVSHKLLFTRMDIKWKGHPVWHTFTLDGGPCGS